ncbi:MAG TPA: SDR family NAD(P)-dependent oxidoreductase [Acidimicrobiia bacterium]
MNPLSIGGFTNLGYRLHARNFDPITADLTGRTVIVTGATGGLGLAAAKGLARLGARVVVVGRNPDKLSVAARIPGEVVPMEADLSLMSEVRDLAGSLLAGEPRIDVLVNNVGVLRPEREMTSEGLEMTLAVDLAGHFLLTNLLIPRLVESAPSRVVNVTSGGMYAERIRPHDLQSEIGTYRGATTYARAKRGQVILTGMWAERLHGTGVTVHAMHPGWARTDGVAGSLPTFDKVMRPLLRTPEAGADTIVWLATDPEPAETSGRLWFDRRQVEEHMTDRTRESPEERRALWDRLVGITGVDFPEGIGRR